MIKMKNIIKGFGFIIALVTTSAQAIPTLYFDGDISFDAASGELSVASVLTATSDIAPAPTLLGSSLDFSALFNSVNTSNVYYTIGSFGSTAATDLIVIDGDANNLLTGNFSYLEMKGGNGFSSGLVSGLLNATGGSLANEFGLGNLIALEFNLSTTFSGTMFEQDFSGKIDGRIEGEASVPEPTMPALLAIGLLLIGFTKRAGIINRI
jgi:hypothetical protein